MNSIIRATSRLAFRPVLDRARGCIAPLAVNSGNLTQKKWTHNVPCTYDFARERIMLVLRLFDKIDPEKLTLDSHFQKDLGLDSLDHTEIIYHIENEFLFEIPDRDSEKLITPRHILTYITDHEEAYEELQKIHASHHHHHYDHHLINKPAHDDHHHHDHHHNSHDSAPAKAGQHQVRHFSTLTYTTRRHGSNLTSSGQRPPKDVDFDDIQQRVMKVCSKYDKIDSSKLSLGSHFVQDLGLDSLDHVEIIMELEDEFGVPIPDQVAEKLMHPADVASYVFKELSTGLELEERPY